LTELTSHYAILFNNFHCIFAAFFYRQFVKWPILVTALQNHSTYAYCWHSPEINLQTKPWQTYIVNDGNGMIRCANTDGQ